MRGINGFEGAQARMAQLEARLGQLAGPQQRLPLNATTLASSNTGFSSTLAGMIAKGKGNEALDPVGMGLIEGPKQNILEMVHAAAERHGIDPKLFEALVNQESGFDPNAVSSAGAKGLTQLMPKTAASLGVTDPFDPAQSLNGGAKYLAQMMREFNGDTRLALAAYNAGPGAVRRAGGIPPFQETQNYVKKIMGRYQGN